MTYLNVSEDTVRLEIEAIQLSKSFNSSDVFWIKRNEGKKEITVDVVTQLIEQSNLASVSGKKLFIIFEADLMNKSAQNKILKTIENADDETTFIFLCKNLTNILPTIRSRSVVNYIKSTENLTLKKMTKENLDFTLIYDYANKFIESKSIDEAILYLPLLSKPENFDLSIHAINQSIKISNINKSKKLKIYKALSNITRNIEANCNLINAFDLLILALFQ